MHRILRRLALALVAAVALTSGVALTPATAAVPGYGTISGVVRGPDGGPVAGVEVTAMEAGRGSNYLGQDATTDASGRYTMEVEAGGYDLRVQDAQERYARADSLDVRVRSGATASRDLAVVRALTLTGRVSRADGGPVAGVTVQASTPDERDWFLEHTATVAADGTYTVRGLHPARWHVLVDPFWTTGALLLAQDLTGKAQPYRDVLVGSTIAVQRDTAVPDVRLQHLTPVVRGVVRGVGGKPVRGVTVHTDDETWWQDHESEVGPYPGIGSETDAAGRYLLRVAEPDANKPLRVSTGETGYAELPFRRALPAIGGTRTVDVRLRSRATVTPTVTSTRKKSTVRVLYRPAVAGASRVAKVTVKYTATNGRSRKVRGTLARNGALTVRLTKVKRGTRSVKVHVAGNADAVAVTRTVKARIG